MATIGMARRTGGMFDLIVTGYGLRGSASLRNPPKTFAAYEYVLRGREIMSHASRETNDEAAGLFQRAIDLDPNYAAAYTALGGSHFEAVVSGWTEFRQEELEQGETLAQKALALDPTTTSAYRLLAFNKMTLVRHLGLALERRRKLASHR
jgi:tetratricopeptide (TPR) repeat protein